MWAMCAKWYFSCMQPFEEHARELVLRVRNFSHKGLWWAASPCLSLSAAGHESVSMSSRLNWMVENWLWDTRRSYNKKVISDLLLALSIFLFFTISPVILGVNQYLHILPTLVLLCSHDSAVLLNLFKCYRIVSSSGSCLLTASLPSQRSPPISLMPLLFIPQKHISE